MNWDVNEEPRARKMDVLRLGTVGFIHRSSVTRNPNPSQIAVSNTRNNLKRRLPATHYSSHHICSYLTANEQRP